MGEERHIDGAIRRALAGQSRHDVGPCPDVNLAAAYIEGSLSIEERAEIEAHAANCTSCQSVLALAIEISDEVPDRMDTSAPASPERRVLFRFTIPVSALAVLLLTAGLAVFLTWNQLAKKPESTELAEMRSRKAPAQAAPESESTGSPSVSRMKAPAAAVEIQEEKQESRSAKSDYYFLEHSTEARKVPAAPASEREAGEMAGMKAEPAHAAAADRRDRENEALLSAASAPPKPEGKVVDGAPGGVVGGIMAPRPAEEAASRISEPAVFQVAGRAGRVTDEVVTPAKDDLALTKEKVLGEQSDAAPVRAQVRENPLDVLRRLAGADKDGSAADTARARSDRSFAATAAMKAGAASDSRRVIAGRTFELYSGYWIDLECVKHLDSDFVEYAVGATESAEIRKAFPGLDELKRTGIPVLLHWKGNNILLQ